ncbi:unnamed protein product [Linum trigynum]|uniref:Uncharacterized protein n=1 Tax=Linum trigynum TaxID=586398 RepID=A0AAV2F9L3_9ROSI
MSDESASESKGSVLPDVIDREEEVMSFSFYAEVCSMVTPRRRFTTVDSDEQSSSPYVQSTHRWLGIRFRPESSANEVSSQLGTILPPSLRPVTAASPAHSSVQSLLVKFSFGFRCLKQSRCRLATVPTLVRVVVASRQSHHSIPPSSSA